MCLGANGTGRKISPVGASVHTVLRFTHVHDPEEAPGWPAPEMEIDTQPQLQHTREAQIRERRDPVAGLSGHLPHGYNRGAPPLLPSTCRFADVGQGHASLLSASDD